MGFNWRWVDRDGLIGGGLIGVRSIEVRSIEVDPIGDVYSA